MVCGVAADSIYYLIVSHNINILYYFILSEVDAEGRCWKEEDGEAGRQSEKP